MKEIEVKTSSREGFVDITPRIKSVIADLEVEDGTCEIYVPHTTAAVTVNENADPNVKTDISGQLKRLIPKNQNYIHREGNSDAHIKSSLVGNTQTVIVNNGELQLGTWQGILFCEFDGPRERRVWVEVNSRSA